MPIVRGQNPAIRELLHGEHAGQYEYRDGMHYLVGDRFKYVWYSQRPTEHLFDLQEDPGETRDLARQADAESLLAPWRIKLAAVLKDRPEGFVSEGKLVIGRPHNHFIPDYKPDGFYPYL